MRVVTKLGIGYGVFLGLLVVLLSYQLSVIRGLVDSNRALSETSSRVSVSSSHMLTLADALSEAADKYALLDEDEGYADQFRRAARSFADTLRHFQTLPLTAGEIAAVERLSVAWTTFLASRPLEDGTSPLLVDNMKDETRALRDASEAAMVAEIGVSADRARTADRLSVAAVIAGLALSLLLSALIVRSISGSLRRLTAGTQAVAEGDFSIRLAEDTGDEFGQVARAFNLMTGKLDEADKAKQNFLSSVSHDLKSPLASMQETTRLLLDEVTGDVSLDQKRLLELSHASGERLSSLIARLLDLARMEAGAMEYNFEAVELTDLCRAAADAAELRVATRGSTIMAKLGAEPVWVRCDAPRIAQVLENLLDNAIKFSPPGAEIGLMLTRPESPDGIVLVSVADRGPGVADPEKERIFDRFYQTETSSPFAGAGVGLGLAICREIAAAHEGTIQIEDNPEGGSIFVLALNHLAAAPHTQPTQEQAPRLTAGGGSA
ncbi:MAG: HAMP domain-containing sensor histidine kinase [Gemmatimonadota bacterium]